MQCGTAAMTTWHVVPLQWEHAVWYRCNHMWYRCNDKRHAVPLQWQHGMRYRCNDNTACGTAATTTCGTAAMTTRHALPLQRQQNMDSDETLKIKTTRSVGGHTDNKEGVQITVCPYPLRINNSRWVMISVTTVELENSAIKVTMSTSCPLLF